MIFHETPMAHANSAANLREKEGYAVAYDSSGDLAVISAATTLPSGVVHIGADEGLPTTIILTSYQGIVGVKLDATPGAVNPGTELIVTAAGTFKARPASGACVVAAIAREAGEGDQLVAATLCAPRAYTA